MKTILLLLFSAVVCLGHAFAQESTNTYPRIGESCPDFIIRNVSDKADSTLLNSYFHDRFFILAFWSKYCSASAASFPVIDALQQEFRDSVRFFLIGTEDKEERMRPMYKAIKEKLNLTIPFAFDSVVFKKFVPGPVPVFVWIDNKGIVQAVTGPLALTSENVRSFLNEKAFQFDDVSYMALKRRENLKLNYFKPFLLAGNGGQSDEYIHRSILIPYQGSQMTYAGLPISLDDLRRTPSMKGLLQGCGPLENLYKFAYTGHSSWYSDSPLYENVYPRCQVRVKDKSLFEVDWVSKKGLYWYSLLVPAAQASDSTLLKAMQQDLERTFGFVAQVRKRKMPCYVLTVDRKARARLKTTHDDKSNDILEPAEIKLTDISMSAFVESIFYKHIMNQPPIIDKTGIGFNIDIHLKVNIYDLEDIKRALAPLGFKLRERKRRMDVIVIADKR